MGRIERLGGIRALWRKALEEIQYDALIRNLRTFATF